MHDLRTHTARSAIAAGLGLALALGGGLAPNMAWAADGSLTITQQHNEAATYDAFCLFTADISSDNKATHLAWASDTMKAAVLAYLDANGYGDWLSTSHPGDDQHDRPQNAAEYIAYRIDKSATDEGAATTPRTTEGASFANGLARALVAAQALPHRTATSGKKFTASQGYWLIVTTELTTGDGEAGTAPIWVPLGGSTKEINEKTSVPTCDKQVREDSGDWGRTADANRAQEVPYRLSGTLPANFGAFGEYHYQFEDTLSAGLEIGVPSGKSIADVISVSIGGRPATVDGTNLSATYANNVLRVEFKDLKSSHWNSYKIGKDTPITVEYQAHLTKDAVIGAAGNSNDLVLTYTHDPNTNELGKTTKIPAPKLFSYAVELTKVDAQTGEALPGAGFTIRVASGNSDKASRGLYVQADGSLATTAHTFVTGDDGTFLVAGVDEGTYTIAEVDVPDGYERIDEDITLVLTSELDNSTISLGNLKATVSGGEHAQEHAEFLTKVSEVKTSSGSVSITATNDRWILMPVTGMEGIRPSLVIGMTVSALAGGGILLRRRRRA